MTICFGKLSLKTLSEEELVLRNLNMFMPVEILDKQMRTMKIQVTCVDKHQKTTIMPDFF